LRVARQTKPDNGYIVDPLSSGISCSVGNSRLPPVGNTANLYAGDMVQVLRNTRPIGHYGPVLNYMAKCPSSDCSPWKGDTGSPLLRHKNFALHGAANLGGAQFYWVCIQLTVTGGGSPNPSGL
ncbi:Polysaccharide monooxygenase Cel61a, partial [Leucoagaricus sp. SymC.cos]